MIADLDDDLAYQEGLKRHGLVISLDLHPAFRASLNALLDKIERSSDPISSRIVRLGRFTVDDADVLLVPNDPAAIRELRLTASMIAGDPAVDQSLRIRAQDLVRMIYTATGEAQPRQETCVRSPCGGDWRDPKVTKEELAAARMQVGQRKKKTARPEGTSHMPLSVSYGLGVDSTAVLVGLAQLYDHGERPEFRPEFITFGDTGGERDETYLYLQPMNEWLDSVDFPRVTIAALEGGFSSRSYGSARTLEQQCLVNHSMPSISQSKKSFAKCSKLWKQQAQNNWFKAHSGLFQRQGRRWSLRPEVPGILKAIGYDADETNRERAGTFRTVDDPDSKFYTYWYPLMSWGWTRARCIAEIEAAGIKAKIPEKSACTYCGMAKKWEIDSLPKDKLLRAILIEEVAKRSRRRRFPKWLVKGPPESWPNWKLEAAQPLIEKYRESGIPQNILMGLPKSMGNRGLGITFAWSDYALERGLIDQIDLDEVIDLAEAIVAEAPKKPGQWDASKGPILSSTAAFTDVPGFRTLGGVFVGEATDDDEEDEAAE